MAPRWLGRPAARLTMVAGAVVALTCTILAVPAWAASEDKTALSIVEQTKSGNEVRLKVFSPAMHKELPVTVLLPKDYGSEDSYPVLYALPGAGETDDRMWATATDIKSFAASHGAVIVLVPTEKGGFFSDWENGAHKWETFHTVELPALIAAKFHGTGKQALMGISLGGFAAMKYAAHHPGQYVAAASMSGVLASSTPQQVALYETTMRMVGQNPLDIWGDPISQHAKWRYEDPSEQIDGLRGTNLFVSSATGVPKFNGSGGDGTPLQRVSELTKRPYAVSDQVLAVGIEQPSHETTLLFAQKAASAGLHVDSHFPLRGQHNWGLWKDEYKVAWSETLARSLGLPN